MVAKRLQPISRAVYAQSSLTSSDVQEQIDAALAAYPTSASVATDLAAKAPLSHGHAEADIANLAIDLAAKEATANKGAASGYAPLDGSSKVPIANLPTGTSSSTVAIGNDSRITGAEQAANKGAASGYCGLDSGSKVAIGNLPTGSSSSTVAVGNDSRLSDSREWSGFTKASGTSVAAATHLTWLTLSSASGNITGTGLVTVMTITGVGAGTWHFKCVLIYQTTAATTGIGVAINHTGASPGSFIGERRFCSTGTAAASGAASEKETGAGTSSSLYEAQGARALATMIGGATASVDSANTDMMMTVEGFLVVTNSGDFQVQLRAEAAALVCTARAGSFLELKKVA